MILSKKYLLHHNSLEFHWIVFKQTKNTILDYQHHDGSDHDYMILLIIIIASMSGTMFAPWWAYNNITIIAKYIFTEWMKRWVDQ